VFYHADWTCQDCTLYIVNTFCILGNEARHFTLKDDTTAARTAATAPAVVPPTYTTIDGLSFVGK
jgi:syndecan 4